MSYFFLFLILRNWDNMDVQTIVEEGFVYVSMNYRLSVFGSLIVPELLYDRSETGSSISDVPYLYSFFFRYLSSNFIYIYIYIL